MSSTAEEMKINSHLGVHSAHFGQATPRYCGLVSILPSPAVCRGSKLTLASRKRTPYRAAVVTSKCHSLLWLPQQPLSSTLSPASQRWSVSCVPKLIESPKTRLLWFELINQTLAREPQSTPLRDPNKNLGPRSYLSPESALDLDLLRATGGGPPGL